METPQDIRFNMLHPTTRRKICQKFNIRRAIGSDFKRLGGELNMTNDEIALISQRDNPTEEIFKWWEPKKEATVKKLLKILEKMGRDDVIDIVNSDPMVQASTEKENDNVPSGVDVVGSGSAVPGMVVPTAGTPHPIEQRTEDDGNPSTSGIVNMDDGGAEANIPGLHIEIPDRFILKMNGRCTLAVIGLTAFYLSSDECKAKVEIAVSNALEIAGNKIVKMVTGSLIVVLQCPSSKRFLADYQSGSVKQRLSEEFAKIGIVEVTVEIENEEVGKESGSSGMAALKESGSSGMAALDSEVQALSENYFFHPPSINVIELKDMNPDTIVSDEAIPHVDVVLIVVNDNELRTFYEILSQPKVADLGGELANVYFGTIGKNSVALVISGAGAGLKGGSQATCTDAIKKLKPKAVLGVGVCFGTKREKQKLADVLISNTWATYAQIRNKYGDVPDCRGVLHECDVRLVKLFRSNMIGWKCPCEDENKANVYNGLIISGPELVDNKDRLEELKSRYPEALGGEMEGEGIYNACDKVPWIICKSICDWGYGTKDKTWQLYAATVAASFVKHVLTKNYIPDIESADNAKSTDEADGNVSHQEETNTADNAKSTDEADGNVSHQEETNTGIVNKADGGSVETPDRFIVTLDCLSIVLAVGVIIGAYYFCRYKN